MVPEEIVTVPGAAIAGAGLGIQTGVIVETFTRETGSAMLEYSRMKDEQGNPMDRDAARMAAFLTGIAITGVELLQIDRVVKSIPGGEALISKMTAPVMRKLLMAPAFRSGLSQAGKSLVGVAKGAVADISMETIQEVLQESIAILGGELGKVFSGQEYASLDLGEVVDRLTDTASSSSQSMTVMFAPGTVMRAVSVVRSGKEVASEKAASTASTLEPSEKDVAVDSNVHEEKIFLPAEAIERYNQDNPGALDTIEVHPQPIEGTDEVMVTAKELDRLKQDAPDLVDSIRGDIRLGADGKTVSELGESVVEKIERESERPEIQKQIAQEIEEKAISAGRPKSEAKVMGKISSSFAMQISRLTGISPQDAVKLDMRKAVFDEVKEGRLRYMDTKKNSAWLDATGLYLPGGGAKQSFLNQNIPTEADLVKVRTEPPGYYQRDLDSNHSAAVESEYMETAQTKLARDVAAWGKTMDSFSSGKLSQKRPFRVMTTPIAMLLADGDIAFKEIITNKSILEKVLKEKHVEVTPELLKQVPAALADPVMVFKSATVSGSYVSMLELRDAEGGTMVVPVALNASEPGKQAFMTSVYGQINKKSDGTVRINDQWFIDQINKGNLRYINTKKSANWARDGGLQLPIMSLPAEALSNSNIPTEADLVKARTENPGYYQDSATPNARLEIFPDGHSLISFFETANKSTSFHEFAHHMFRMMVDLRDVPGADAQFKADVDTVFREAGVSLEAFQNDSAARTEVHEFFARGFETYLSEGKAPTKALRGAFKHLRAWLIGVYRDVVASLGIELSDPMRDVYARLLAAQEDIDRETTINHLAAEMIALKKEIKSRSEEMRKAESEAIEFERPP